MIGLSFPLCPRLFWHRSQSGHCLTRYPPCRNPPPPGDWERNSFGAACRGENEVLYVFFWLIFSQINPGNGRKWAFLSSFWEKISTGRPGGPPPPGAGEGCPASDQQTKPVEPSGPKAMGCSQCCQGLPQKNEMPGCWNNLFFLPRPLQVIQALPGEGGGTISFHIFTQSAHIMAKSFGAEGNGRPVSHPPIIGQKVILREVFLMHGAWCFSCIDGVPHTIASYLFFGKNGSAKD